MPSPSASPQPGTELVPSGRTARRLEWAHLPPSLRAEVERRLGSPVLEASSQGGGFTPGFASVLTCADGSRHFVKAASLTAQRAFATAYAEEARKLAALPRSVPAPHLRWSVTGPEWVALETTYVEARAPRRPWREDDLVACLGLTTALAELLTPAPPGLALDTVAADFADYPPMWEHVRATRPDLAHLDEAADLAAEALDLTAGDTLVHTDLRDDNLLLTPDGRVLVCDWNWPVLGAPWLDTVMLLLGPRGDGLDVEQHLATHPLTCDVPAGHVDALLALLVGYFWRSADQPVPSSSPWIRAHQAWSGRVAWGWLADRRGWR